MIIRIQSMLLATAVLFSSAANAAPDPFADVEIKTTPVAGTVHMLTGAGGNVAISLGGDGTLIVDDQFLPLAPRIQAAIDGLGGGRPAFILNTHYHGDHMGGNPFFGETGTIVAHENVRVRLLDGDLPAVALPVITYSNRMAVHFNGEEIALLHLPQGHTDGDSAVWFKQSNVLHTGRPVVQRALPLRRHRRRGYGRRLHGEPGGDHRRGARRYPGHSRAPANFATSPPSGTTSKPSAPPGKSSSMPWTAERRWTRSSNRGWVSNMPPGAPGSSARNGGSASSMPTGG